MENLSEALKVLDPSDAQYASLFVDVLLAAARRVSASDVHLQPTASGLELRWRVDGVLVPLGEFPPGVAANVVARLKVLADLLTYRNDVPQEGRLRAVGENSEVRVSTFPTLHGERAVIRLFAARRELRRIEQLGLPEDVLPRFQQVLGETSGAILVTGPAGSGKTTTLYASLHELTAASQAPRSIVTLEDPIEMAIAGVSQSQVNPAVGFDLAAGLRSVLRQDPEVIMIGEMRDAATAGAALQAALTGQLVLTSFHAGSAAEALSRLLDMGIEPYLLPGGVLAVLHQRLVRKLCSCSQPADSAVDLMGFQVAAARVPGGCGACNGIGFRGRLVLAEMLTLSDPALNQALLGRADLATLERCARAAGMVDRWQRAITAIEAGWTSPAEVRRVLGFSRFSAG
jgi:type II secretory ATPase GspE/PulE/Tfp pilus assembly ATPase PilB-like protein